LNDVPPKAPTAPPECLNSQRDTHFDAAAASSSFQVKGEAPCNARKLLCPVKALSPKSLVVVVVVVVMVVFGAGDASGEGEGEGTSAKSTAGVGEEVGIAGMGVEVGVEGGVGP